MSNDRTDFISQFLPGGMPADPIVFVVAICVACVIFLIIREFWCWFWKTTEIAEDLERLNYSVHGLWVSCAECQKELVKANALLERMAASVPEKSDKPQTDIRTG